MAAGTGFHFRRSRSSWAACVGFAAVLAAGGAQAQVRRFDIPAQPAGAGIVAFGRQAQVQLLAPAWAAGGLRTRAVRGEMDVREALAQLLRGTGLVVASDRGQVILLRRGSPPPETRAAEQAAEPPRPRVRWPAPSIIPPEETLDLGAVTVSASRIQSMGFTAPTATTVLAGEEILRRGGFSLQEAINDLPQFRPSSTPQTSSGATTGTNAGAGQALLDLRGLGTARTLLLINGRRAGASNDLNQFPAIMAKRIDVVTGGASAAYGSDAVAGVVNLILDTNFTGFKTSVTYTGTKYGDGEGWRGAAEFGAPIMGGRGHVLLAADYMEHAAQTSEADRPWMHEGRYVQIANGASASNGLPPYINAADEHFSTVAPGGLITAGPLKGITFEDGGVPRQFRYGTVIGNYMLGGENPNPLSYNILPRTDRYAVLGRFDLELGHRTRAWAEVNLSAVDSETVNPRPIDQGSLTIKADNPFIPAAIRSQMTALGLTSLTMGRLNLDGGQPVTLNHNVRNRYTVGAEGEVGRGLLSGWRWDAFAQYGVADSHVKTTGSRNTARWLQALDTVGGPNGTPVCRDPTGGCAPFNIFGPNAASQAARDFVFGVQTSQTERRQTNIGFNLRGSPFEIWAGPVDVAVGAEYRRETQNTFGDPIAAAQGWDSGNVQPLKGAYEVKEAYLEANLPLASRTALAHALAVNGAVRFADYSTAGGTVAWKLGGTWQLAPDLLFRGTVSRDVRAPNIAELYAVGVSNLQNAINVRGPNAGLGVIVPLYTSGNPDLKMEKANTFTAGATWRPMGGRVQLSADYYSATVLNQIGSIGWNAITNRCVQGLQSFCELIKFDAVGNIVSVNNPTINNNRFVARSIDFEARYSQPLDRLWSPLKGRLEGRALATRALEFSVDDGTTAGKIDRVGGQPTFIATTSMPRWTGAYFITYEVGGFQTTLQFRYVSAGVMEPTSITGTATERLNNKVSSQTTAFLSARYNFRAGGRAFQVFGRINNLFNRGPPFPVYPLSQLGTFYDASGTVYRVGFRTLF